MQLTVEQKRKALSLVRAGWSDAPEAHVRRAWRALGGSARHQAIAALRRQEGQQDGENDQKQSAGGDADHADHADHAETNETAPQEPPAHGRADDQRHRAGRSR